MGRTHDEIIGDQLAQNYRALLDDGTHGTPDVLLANLQRTGAAPEVIDWTKAEAAARRQAAEKLGEQRRDQAPRGRRSARGVEAD